MKLALVTVLAGLVTAPLASAQKIDLKFEALAAKATAKSEVDLDSNLLRFALKQAGQEKGALSGVQAVHVRNYEFAKAGEYSDKDLEPLRKQVATAAGWSKPVNVKEKDESTEVYLAVQGDKVNGCLIIAAEAKELTVVYLEGTMALAQIKELVDSNVKYNLAALLQ